MSVASVVSLRQQVSGTASCGNAPLARFAYCFASVPSADAALMPHVASQG